MDNSQTSTCKNCKHPIRYIEYHNEMVWVHSKEAMPEKSFLCMEDGTHQVKVDDGKGVKTKLLVCGCNRPEPEEVVV